MTLSIIIPLYNAANTLKTCLDSILESIKSTNRNESIEIIIIDDGSTDDSGNISDKYAKQNANIKVLHTINKGVSCARNLGINVSCGEYVSFIDADDIICKNGINYIYDAITKYNADMIFFSYISKDYNGKATKLGYSFTDCKKTCSDIRISFYKDGGLSPWGKLIRRKLIVDNNIKFNSDLKIHEDVIFLFDCFLKAHTIAYDSSSFYQYNYTIGGALRKADPIYISNYEYVYSYFINYLNCFFPPELLKDEVNKLNNEYLHKLLILACRLKKALYKRSYIKKMFESNELYKTLIKEKYTGINIIKKWLLKYHLYTVGALKIK